MCDSVVALGPETADGHTLFAKNSDRKSDESQPFVQHAGAHHAPGSALRCTHIEIPQVAETYRVMGHSPWWVWGFEHGVNEHAVAIGNQTVFSNEPVEDQPGLIGMDLVRLGLERGRTAREALEVIATLLETCGQGGPALGPDAGGYHNSFLLADPTNAWVLETSNRRWAARQVKLAACTNHYSLDGSWDIASRDFEAFARREGWWRSDHRVDVAAALRNPDVPGAVSDGRHRRATELLVEGRGRLDVSAFQTLLRDHATGGPVWTGADASVEDERYFTLCAHSEPVHWTTASLVAALPATRPFAWPVWISFATPCTGVFLPVYLDGVIPASLARSDEPNGLASAEAKFRQLRDATRHDPEAATRSLRAGWAAFEAEIDSERVEIERAARAAASARDHDQARDLLTRFMDRCVARALEHADESAAELVQRRDPADDSAASLP